VTIDQDFLDVCLMEIPVNDTIAVNDEKLTKKLIKAHPDRDFRHWPFGSKLSHFLEYAPQPSMDLWGDAYKPKFSRKGDKTFMFPLVLIGVAIVFKLLFESYRYVSLNSEISSIRAETRDILVQNFPELGSTAVGAERELMQKAISKMGGPDRSKSMHSALAEAAKILGSRNISLLNIVYRNNELVLTCMLNDFSQVDMLTKQFNSSPSLTASLQSSASDEGSVIANYSLKHK